MTISKQSAVINAALVTVQNLEASIKECEVTTENFKSTVENCKTSTKEEGKLATAKNKMYRKLRKNSIYSKLV